jgi:hypothetical protein
MLLTMTGAAPQPIEREAQDGVHQGESQSIASVLTTVTSGGGIVVAKTRRTDDHADGKAHPRPEARPPAATPAVRRSPHALLCKASAAGQDREHGSE